MRLSLRKPTQALNKAYAKQSITQDRMDTFRRALTRLFSRMDENESEEHQKNIIAGFLNDAFYANGFELNTRERIDLVIHRGPAGSDPAGKSMPGVIIEAKKTFAGEMMTTLKNNVKALHELILYYFEERERHHNIAISQLVITDVYNWFIFDENDFRHHFYDNPKLRKLYQIKQQQKKDNPFFYAEVAKILRELDDEVPVTYLDLRKAADALELPDYAEGNRRLIPVYKLFSPEHLLKLPFANDANTLNRQFYNELLHLIGLHEIFDGSPSRPGRKLIQRLPEGERHDGSLLENTINLLRVNNALAEIETPEQYGRDETEQLFNVGLGLCITWLNRILFLKLLEGQLIRYHRSDRSVQFLTSRHIREFDELNELFFGVLAVPEANRPAGIVTRYGAVPYLNSSLFELTDLERKALKIKELKDRLELPLFGQTALKDMHGKRQTGQLPTLQYLLAFLDAYDFSSDGPAEVQPDNKPLINAAVLGLIFEKLNGYRDGSFFTPGFITMYMVRETVRKAAVSRFNEQFGWQCADVTALYNRLGDVSMADANAVINSLRIVDPAVGSGHFLVSALNELIALKAELGVLTDRDGRRLRYYDVSIVNDELVITDEEGEPFQYFAPGVGAGTQRSQPPGALPSAEIQRVQETIFHEKQTLIENCLFGVDINPNSVNICRLRLWIELLKSAYYAVGTEALTAKREAFRAPPETPASTRPALQLATLPNLDINLKAGNSLVSRFTTAFRVDGLRNQSMREKFLPAFQRYSVDVLAYKHVRDKAEKDRIRGRIRQFREFVQQIAFVDQKDYAELKQIEAKLAQASQTFDFFVQDQRLRSLSDLLETKRRAFLEKQRVFQQAFEWRFEFPEVLDETGNFVGFDVVVGNPPYGVKFDIESKKFLNNTYSANTDIYSMFIERSFQLLRQGGQLGYVIPTSWQTGENYISTRRMLTESGTLEIGIILPYNVFDEAYVDTGIYMLTKSVQESYVSNVFEFDPKTKIEGKLTPYLNFSALPSSAWTSTADLRLTFNVKLGSIRQRLATNQKTIQTISSSVRGILADKGDVADYQIDASYKPLFTGRLNRYVIEPVTSFVRYGDNLKEKPKSYVFFTGERIVVRRIVSRQFRLMATLVEEEFVCKKDLYTFIITNPAFSAKYILAILNSALISHLKTSGSTAAKKDDFTQLTLGDIREIPIPDVSPEAQAPLVALVDAILSAKRDNAKADTSALERQLDELVFDLYGLSAEERALIIPVTPG